MTPRAPRLGRVQAVAVTYDSGPEIESVAAAALAESDGLVIVDNGSTDAVRVRLRALADASESRIALIENGENLGLDRAQNQGIAAARARGADWILLLDDDSLVAPGLLAASKGRRGGAILRGLAAGLAGLGPAWRQRRDLQRRRRVSLATLAAALTWNPLRFLRRDPDLRPEASA